MSEPISDEQWKELEYPAQHSDTWHAILDLHHRMKKLEGMHQETTHVHTDDLLSKAHEILLKMHTNANHAPYPGMAFDISNWLDWYYQMRREAGHE